jgi:hypothetical protein
MASLRSFAESRGLGWTFEVDDDDEDDDDQKPLLEELEIDPADIARKLRCACVPPADGAGGELTDFWGPVAVMMLYAALVVWGQMSVVSWILSIWLVGSCVIFFFARVSGADLTLTHTLSSLGYCAVPLVFARVLLALVGRGYVSVGVRCACIAWATWSASRWMGVSAPELAPKRALLVWPIGLYMFYMTALATGV